MISQTVLEQAVARSIISAEQAAALHALAATRVSAASGEPEDEERLRFISGFGDIFVTIGLALFLGASAYFIGRQTDGRTTWIALAAIAWLLAEFFTRRQRMALPSIVLLLVFAGTSFAGLAQGMRAASADPRPTWFLPLPWYLPDLRDVSLGLPALVTLGLIALHYWRFRVPVTIAAGAAALVTAIVSFTALSLPSVSTLVLSGTLLVCGLLTFAAAMAFDMSDPQRLTRRTDVAFWLHMLAAPLIVHPLVRGIIGVNLVTLTSSQAVAILAIFLLLGVVALITDRRAILVSGLLYAGYAFGSIIRGYGWGDTSFPATLLALGAFVLLLSAGWRPLRTLLLRALPVGVARRLPHPVLSVSP